MEDADSSEDQNGWTQRFFDGVADAFDGDASGSRSCRCLGTCRLSISPRRNKVPLVLTRRLSPTLTATSRLAIADLTNLRLHIGIRLLGYGHRRFKEKALKLYESAMRRDSSRLHLNDASTQNNTYLHACGLLYS